MACILRRLPGPALFSLVLGACDAPAPEDAPVRDAAFDGPSLDAPTDASADVPRADGAIDSGTPGPIVDAASCARADVEAAIARAASGDTVRIPGGSAMWDATVTIPSTIGITLDGGGCRLDGRIRIEQHPTASSRVTNFEFVGRIIDPFGFTAVATSGAPGSAPFRIDNSTFVADEAHVFIDTNGNGPGLIDHNRFECPRNCEMIHLLGMGPPMTRAGATRSSPAARRRSTSRTTGS